MNLLNNILKFFVGDKNQKDLKELEGYISEVTAFEANLKQVTIDELRAKTVSFQELIQEAIATQQSEIKRLQEEVTSEEDLLKKEAIYEKIDSINKEAYEKSEEVLLQILPEAFAVIKETARRFAGNNTIEVTANESDRKYSALREYVTLSGGEKAIWNTSWDAAGKEVKWDMIHYDVQLIGGSVLHQGKIAEMATGEGKTLVSTLPVYLNALTGRGVHVVTVNDYLARRDSAWMQPIYEFHGLVVDCIDNHEPNSVERKQAYLADITYGTNNAFGFDYLRDNMAHAADKVVQRELNYAIIDEVDSVLIDDARTPLIISGPVGKSDSDELFHTLKGRIEHLVGLQSKMLIKTLSEAKKLITEGNDKEGGFKLLQVYRGLPKNKALIKFLSKEGVRALLQKTENFYMQDNNREMHKIDNSLYFTIEEKNNQITLTDLGIDTMSGKEERDFFVMPDIGMQIAEIEKQDLSEEEQVDAKEELYRDFGIKSERIHVINQLLKAYTLFEKDVEYVVMEGKVNIVDEQTGRIMDGRRYSDGLHQAIEAKENVTIEAATQTYATVTLQNYFRMYNKLSGMTGTAETEAGELWEIYKLDVVAIPTNKPIARDDKQDLVYKTNREKYKAVIEEVVRLSKEENRPVLVGTTSVEISELLSRALRANGIKHNVLNAKLHKKEADIVTEAGEPGTVTIATNMAGRGTDIKLSKEVIAAGGLAIIGTERHDSRRVDRQLRGRAGRQGDVGSSQFYASLEDKLMRLFGSEKIAKLMDRMGLEEGEVIQHSMISKSIERAQKKVEENNFGVRKRLLEYDDVMNKQREVIYKRRRNALSGKRLQIDITDMIYDLSRDLVHIFKSDNDYETFEMELISTFGISSPITEEEFSRGKESDLIQQVNNAAIVHYLEKETKIAVQVFPVIQDVHKNQPNFERIAVPITDGIKTMNVHTNISEAIETEGKQVVRDFEKGLVLAFIDNKWKDHLREMDDLKRSVQLAVHEQKDPLLIYKEESFNLFRNMMGALNKETISFLFRGEVPAPNSEQIEQSRMEQERRMAEAQQRQLQASRSADASQGGGVLTSEERSVKKPLPRKVVKIGRNDIVTIKNVQTGEAQEMKFKKALPLLESRQWVVTKKH